MKEAFPPRNELQRSIRWAKDFYCNESEELFPDSIGSYSVDRILVRGYYWNLGRAVKGAPFNALLFLRAYHNCVSPMIEKVATHSFKLAAVENLALVAISMYVGSFGLGSGSLFELVLVLDLLASSSAICYQGVLCYCYSCFCHVHPVSSFDF